MVFVDTGLEYPELREFVKSVENVIWVRPKMNFKKVIQTYGYPVISKEQSAFIQEYRDTHSKKLMKYSLQVIHTMDSNHLQIKKNKLIRLYTEGGLYEN